MLQRFFHLEIYFLYWKLYSILKSLANNIFHEIIEIVANTRQLTVSEKSDDKNA